MEHFKRDSDSYLDQVLEAGNGIGAGWLSARGWIRNKKGNFTLKIS